MVVLLTANEVRYISKMFQEKKHKTDKDIIIHAKLISLRQEIMREEKSRLSPAGVSPSRE